MPVWGVAFPSRPLHLLSASRSCLTLLDPKKTHSFFTPPKLQVSFPASYPDRCGPLKSLFPACMTAAPHSFPLGLLLWQAADFTVHEQHGESREGRGSLGTAMSTPACSAPWGAPSAPSRAPICQSIPYKLLEEKPICVHSVRSPRRGGLPGELERSH